MRPEGALEAVVGLLSSGKAPKQHYDLDLETKRAIREVMVAAEGSSHRQAHMASAGSSTTAS